MPARESHPDLLYSAAESVRSAVPLVPLVVAGQGRAAAPVRAVQSVAKLADQPSLSVVELQLEVAVATYQKTRVE